MRAARQATRLRLTRANSSVQRGQQAVYAVTVTSTHGFTGAVTLSVDHLPQHTTASFAPPTVTVTASGAGRTVTSTLTVSTSALTALDRSTLTVTARSGRITGSTTGVLTVSSVPSAPSQRRFAISGHATGALSPGVTVPIDVTLFNPDPKSLAVANVTVKIRSVTPLPGRSCSADDYTMSQYTGPYPLTVPGQAQRSLSQLGVPARLWPQATFVNRPVNQDGCRGARVELGYVGSGHGS
ncbi:MAG: hypothetical protein ABIQ59_03705 [Nocardioidaceae bacterium]